MVVGLALNDVVGSGVYLLPSDATALLGVWSLGAVAAAAFVVLLVVLCFAEAATHFDQPGGAYLYARAAFGDLIGFEVGWMAWLTRVASVASLSVGFSLAISHLWPGASYGVGRALLISVPLVGLTWINLVGVRYGARTAVVLVIAKLVPLGMLVVVGAFAFSRQVFTAQQAVAPPDAARLGEGALLLLFAFAGFENTSAPAGEYRRPRRDVPFALLTQLALVAGLYLAVQLVALGTLPGLPDSQTPLADSARLILGPWGGLLLTVGAAASILGTNNNSVLAGPRYLFALARDGYGPRVLARVHPRWRTPAAAILLQSALALPLALYGSFVGLAALSVVARLATYLGTALAVPVLRRKAAAGTLVGTSAAEEAAAGVVPATEDETGGAAAARELFRLPGGPAIPIAAATVSIALAASATAANLLAAAAALAVGVLVWALRRPPGSR
jgi:amino acid transporter